MGLDLAEHLDFPGKSVSLSSLESAVGSIFIVLFLGVFGIGGVIVLTVFSLVGVCIWLATRGADPVTWFWWIAGIVTGAVGLAALYYYVVLLRLMGRIMDCSTKPQQKDGVLPVSVVEKYPDGKPRIIVAGEGDASDDSQFAYHYTEEGHLLCQTRMGGRICQRVIDKGRLGLHVERLSVEEFQALSINRLWNWISDLPRIPPEAHAIELLAFGFCDTPRPEIDYSFWLSYRIGAAAERPSLRQDFLAATDSFIPDWGLTAPEHQHDHLEKSPPFYKPFVSSEIVAEDSSGSTVLWAGQLLCSRTALEVAGDSDRS